MSPNSKMKPPPNYYKLLGVPSTATTSEITRAYHKKILQVHVDKCPDKNPNLCYETIEAYRILSNQNTRTKYDIQRDSHRSFLTDRELVERYKSDLVPGEAVTPEIILKLREKYNLEREDHEETFVPAGEIEYNVEDQLSSILMKRIQAWETDFTETKHGVLKDNYFECYSNLVNKVLRSDSTTNQFWCTTCDKNFLNGDQHSEEVLQPYLNYFKSDKENLNVTSIYDFFHIQFGKLFTWEPEYLPKKPLGIWGLPKWQDFPIVQAVLCEQISALLPADFFEDLNDHMAYIQASFYQPAAEYICWVLEYSDVEELNDMAKSLLCSKNLSDILTFIAVLCEFLAFSNWEALCDDALEEGEIELTLLWMKARELLGLAKKNEWINLGMTIHSYKDDPYLSHFCFLLEPEVDWDLVAGYFTEDGDHMTAITYQLYADKPSALLQTYLKLCDTNPKSAQIYRNVYYSKKIRAILLKLVQNRNTADLEELIGIIQILFPDPSEPFNLIANIYAEYFQDPVFNPIHRNAMEQIQALPITFKTLKLILGALHYLPSSEVDADEYFLASHWSRLCRNELERSMATSDFEKLTRALLNLNRWSLPAANEVLREILEPGEEALSSHVRGMMLLLRGTIQKLEKNWIGATTDYQAALLNTPECLYRLTPCVSMLTQDIEYHEGILSQVQSSLTDLKENFDDGNYIQIDTSVHSLVVTDVVPQEEFGYKDLAPKIQLEPPPLRNENQDIQAEEREPPPVETNTPLLTMDKVERAIEVGADQNKPMDALSSALAYVDLLKALPLNLHHGPIVMAASHFLRAMNETDNPTSLYAYRNAILEMAGKLLGLDRQVSARVQSCLTHKHMFSIALMANQRLSQCVGSAEAETDQSAHLISNTETEVLETLLRSVVGSSQVEPLANIPTLSCSDLSYVEKVKGHYLQAFCADKIQQKYQSACIPSHVHAYTLFLETWRGRCGSSNFEKARTVAIDTFLKHNGCSMEDMREFMDWRQDDPAGILLGYQAIDGFKIDLKTGEISFLLSRGSVFTAKDLLEVFENDIENATLSLEHPGLEFQSHPCKEACFQPEALVGTDYMKCLLRASMLMHSFATGVEICKNPPFGSILVYQSLFEGLPEHLQYFLRPLQERIGESESSKFRFCISLSEAYEEIEESGTEFVYKVGNVRAEVQTDTNSSEAGTADHQFASDFTKHFDEIGAHFAEFYKLKELKKLTLIHAKLREVLRENSELLSSSNSTEDLRIAQSICKSINNLGIHLNSERKPAKPKGCIWVPSPSCHIEYPDSYEVLGGVKISGQPIYGPCSVSPSAAFVPAQDLILELEYYNEVIKSNQPTQYFTVTVDLNSVNGQQQQYLTPLSSNPSHYSPDFDYEFGPIEGADLEAPYTAAWTSPTAIPTTPSMTLISRPCPHVSQQSSLPTVTEDDLQYPEEEPTDEDAEILSVDYDTGPRVLTLQPNDNETLALNDTETESDFNDESSESELHACFVTQQQPIRDSESEVSSEVESTDSSLADSVAVDGDVDTSLGSDASEDESESESDSDSEMLGRVTVQEVIVRTQSTPEVPNCGIEVAPILPIALIPDLKEDSSSTSDSETEESDPSSDKQEDLKKMSSLIVRHGEISAASPDNNTNIEPISAIKNTDTEEHPSESQPNEVVIPDPVLTTDTPVDQVVDARNSIEAISETSTEELISGSDDEEYLLCKAKPELKFVDQTPSSVNEFSVLENGAKTCNVVTVAEETLNEHKAISDSICDLNTIGNSSSKELSNNKTAEDKTLPGSQKSTSIENLNEDKLKIKSSEETGLSDQISKNDCAEDQQFSESTSEDELASAESEEITDTDASVGVDAGTELIDVKPESETGANNEFEPKPAIDCTNANGFESSEYSEENSSSSEGTSV